ncbi:MAG: sugar transferase [Clostridia bacterium]|nr:sugar transferase [Clostridia bacterium]
MYRFFKRFIDILVSLVALPFVLLVVLCSAPVIYLTDKGPVFYNAERKGKDGKIFKMYKLRSMYVNAPNIKNSDGSTFNSANDPRVTRVGKFLRKTSLDEFPQFFNVLIGDMSLIGPRPTLPGKSIPVNEMDEIRRKRYSVRPGITGYAQAYYRNSITQDEKFMHDAYYVDNLSFVLDVKVIFKTVLSVIGQKNIHVSDAPVPMLQQPVTVTSVQEEQREPAQVK